MNIKLKKLTLINFKGSVNKTLNFNDQAFVFGDNATGKTTLFDGFTWLLFGKDSSGRSDFEIKTLDKDGVIIPQIDHEVIGELEVDNKTIVFRRTLREKWVKKRGFEETHFEGNETIYFIDDVPKSKREYESYISDIVDENLFKLITSPTAFNAVKWQDRRKTLLDLVGGINQDEIIKGMDATADQKQFVINLLASDKSISDQKKTIAAKIKTQKDELKMIPTRIDEAQRSKPEQLEDSFDSIRFIMNEQKELIESLDNQINNKSEAFDKEAAKITAKKRELFDIKESIQTVESTLKEEAVKKTLVDTSAINHLKDLRTEKNMLIKSKESILNTISEAVNQKRLSWTGENAKEFKTETKCPTCERDIEKDVINSIEIKFKEQKAKLLAEINKQGAELATDSDRIKAELSQLKEELTKISNQIDEAEKKRVEPTETITQVFEKLSNNSKELIDLRLEAYEAEKNIKALTDKLITPDTSELKEQRATILKEIDRLKAILLNENTIKQIDGRISDLKGQETTLAQSIASVERDLFLIDKYNKSSIESLEVKINSLFTLVNFKMFEKQINGGEAETCKCTVDGVPYSDLNTAMKINAGLDIINTLSSHYKAIAPIFIDGRESVVKLIDTKSQIINLVVSEHDKTLRVI